MSVIIRLQKLPLTANASDVRSFFKGLSIPDGGVHIVGGEMGDAFIAFSTDEDARQAMALNGGRINNEPVALLLSSRAEMQKVIDQARKAALMQLSRVTPAVTAGLVAARPKVPLGPSEVSTKPTVIPGVGALGALASIGTQLPKFINSPAAANGSNAPASVPQQKPQPPVISLAGFLAKAQSAAPAVGNSSLLTTATAAAPAAQSASLGPLLSSQMSYNEIPGLSFLSSTPTAGLIGSATGATASADVNLPSALTASNLSGWLSALNGQLSNKGTTALLNGTGAADRIDTSFLANNVTPLNLNGTQKDVNGQQSTWKFLKKDRRSRSSSRERKFKRVGRSRSSSRDRDVKRDRCSRSSSRGRSFKRDGRNSRSSSRDRGSRSWSRGSSRDRSSRRLRNSRSRSPSRDRFGRTRHRSRSRSPRTHRSRDSSRDRSREPSGGRYDRDARQGQNRGRFSHFSGREQNNHHQQQHPDQWSTLDNVFTGKSKPAYGLGMTREVEPIFGLHTTPGALAQASGGSNFFSTRSGKISPPPMYNGNPGGGGTFRNTSPLPDSVYSAMPQSLASSSGDGPTTSDYAIKISNLDSVTGYGEIRRIFKSQLISTQGIKMINDQTGRRTGVAYVQFLRKEWKRAALLRDGLMMRRMRIRIESITDQEFERAIDSYRPGSDKGSFHQQRQQQQQNSNQQSPWSGDAGNSTAPWSANSAFLRGADDKWDGSRGGSNVNYDANDQDQQQNASDTYAPTSALLVWNLPTYTTEQDIMKMFSDFTVVEVLIVKNHSIPKQVDGYVRFHRQEDAKEAWSQLHRHYIGIKKMTVRMCSELDYAVAKNEYENPGDTTRNRTEYGARQNSQERGNSEDGGNSQDGGGHSSERSQPREASAERINLDGGNNVNNDGEQLQLFRQHPEQQQYQQDVDSNERRVGGPNNSGVGDGQGRRSGGARKKRWDTEKNWDEEEGIASPASSSMAPQKQMMDSDAGAGSDTNASWVDRHSQMNCREDQDSSQANDSNNHFGNGGDNGNYNQNDSNNDNNGMNMRDPRRQQPGSSSARGGRFGGGNSVDNSELFHRTTCLLLRNVDFHVYEEDVFQFFAEDGFHAKNVLLVRNERGKRTGECLVEFGSPSEAAHAESKSSQNLGRRKVFASHLDRGQVQDLMKRFDAIAEGRRSPSDSCQGERDGRGAAGSYEDPEESQGVGCGPYRTSTVGLLNLAYKTTVVDVQNFFREFDLPLENIRRRFLDNGQPTGEAMVRFRNHLDAEKALNEYQNRKMFGRNVRIRLINDD